MGDILIVLYPWIKSLHLISVISWMAGLFYLPRIFVYHVERSDGKDQINEVFLIMEKKLHSFIMTPAMIVSWICGFLLAATPGIIDFSHMWVWVKLLAIIAMTLFNIWLGLKISDFKTNNNSICSTEILTFIDLNKKFHYGKISCPGYKLQYYIASEGTRCLLKN